MAWSFYKIWAEVERLIQNLSPHTLKELSRALAQKNVITDQDANYIRETGKGATFKQAQVGADQTGQGKG